VESLPTLQPSEVSLTDSSVEEGQDIHLPIEQTMERMPRGARRLAAQLRTPVRIDSLWSVLTDYNRLSEFIPNLSVSRLVGRSGNRVKLEQVGCQKLIGVNFSAKVQLELVEDENEGSLSFSLIKGDFRRFEGAWRMKSLVDGGSCLLYELIVQGCIGMPVALIEQRLKDDLTANLLSVEKEAIRRTSYSSAV